MSTVQIIIEISDHWQKQSQNEVINIATNYILIFHQKYSYL